MLLLMLCFAAGVMTIVSPCVLPVLPFVLARSHQPLAKGMLPVLVGLAATFSSAGILASYLGDQAAAWGSLPREGAMLVMALCGASLLSPRLATWLSRPWTSIGNAVASAPEGASSGSDARTVLASFGIGAATGLLWAPCAGPILGLVLTSVAIQGGQGAAAPLMLSYAVGAGLAMAAAIWAGGRLLSPMKRALLPAAWLRRVTGALVLASVAMLVLGWDTTLLGRAPALQTHQLEQRWLDLMTPIQPGPSASRAAPIAGKFMKTSAFSLEATPQWVTQAVEPPLDLPIEGQLPELNGLTTWLNSSPLTRQQLRGKVVLIDFWTFGCINCQRALPHVKAWYEKYKDQGLVVIGVHAPEFAYEHNVDNVRRAAERMGFHFPIAIDNDFAVWRSFGNQYWPANYFIDAQGRIRFHHFGEGEYEKSERVIRQLLQEAKSSRADT